MQAADRFRLLSWNIRNTRRIDDLFSVIQTLSPDLIVLNEYRPRESDIRDRFQSSEWRHFKVAHSISKPNGILIASRFPMESGTLAGPEWAPGSLLHVEIPELALALIGLRFIIPVPSRHKGAAPAVSDFDKALRGDRRVQMDWLATQVLPKLKSKNVVVTGDFNIALTYGTQAKDVRFGSDLLRGILTNGWRSAFTAEDANPANRKGRIDHTFFNRSATFEVYKAEDVTEAASIRLCGLGGISDHAAMLAEFRVRLST